MPYGLYEFNVLLFGLCNGPATFQRLMDLVLAGLQMSQCLVYIDDMIMIVVGCTFDEHLCNLREVFRRVRGAGLKLKPSKCTTLGMKSLRREKLPTPQISTRLPTGPCPNQSRTYKNSSVWQVTIADLFTTLQVSQSHCPDYGNLEWTVECQAAFAELCHKLFTAPVLAFPDFTKPFILDTDASNTGIGGVLS